MKDKFPYGGQTLSARKEVDWIQKDLDSCVRANTLAYFKDDDKWWFAIFKLLKINAMREQEIASLEAKLKKRK
jgi:hypothetical protein